MVKKLTSLLLLLAFSSSLYAFGDHTINIETNILGEDIGFQDNTSVYVPSSNNISYTDDFPEFIGFDITSVGNHQGGMVINGVLFSVQLIGARYGKTFILSGKVTEARLEFPNSSITSGFTVFQNNGCEDMLPTSPIYSHARMFIKTSDDMTRNCSGQTSHATFSGDRTIGPGNRTVLINLNSVYGNNAPTDIPPDSYYGSVTFAPITWNARVGDSFTPNLTVNLKVNIQHYFSGFELGSRELNLNAKKVTENGEKYFIGRAQTTLSLLGKVAPHNKIMITALSRSGDFTLQKVDTTGGVVGTKEKIPYRVDIDFYGTPKTLVKNGVATPIFISPISFSAPSGRLTFDFKSAANTLSTGRYNDIITLMAELVL
ncbi:hypothetical protein [Aeromonas veronii]|uniref:hypothetical protein n=1 Tax=Aeromonas veronii TaxID=654 RepID=UPI003D214BB7